jgi:glycosyltransferase involved in cell wall biosynthesis
VKAPAGIADRKIAAESGPHQRITVVLPCLNEERAIGSVIDEAWEGIASTTLEGEVVVVDNGSTDRSVEIAEQHGARVVHEPRRGYGSAYLRGLAEARGEIIVMADADGTYPLGDLRPFVEHIEDGAEMVLGSRFRGRIQRGAMPWKHRWIGNPLLTAVLNIFFGVHVSDAHCGLRAIRRSVVPGLQLHATGMEFASEMILKAAKRGLRVDDVPIEYRPRIGESKLHTWRDGWRHLRFMLVHSATFLFLIPGAILLVLGLAVLIPMIGGPVHVFGVTWHIHAMIVASMATLVGAQIVQLGLFARTYAILYLDDRDRILEWLWTKVRLEHGLVIGALGAVAGLAVMAVIFIEWAGNGFGALSRVYLALFSLTLVGLGVQTVFGSFFLSVLGLRSEEMPDLGAPPERDAVETEAGGRVNVRT